MARLFSREGRAPRRRRPRTGRRAPAYGPLGVRHGSESCVNHGGSLVIFKQVVEFCWFCVRWGLLIGAIGAAVVAFFFRDRVDEEIRCRVLEQIARHYRDLRVTARSAALVEDGIEIRGLTISMPEVEGPRAELAYYDEVHLSCQTDLQKLIRGEVEVQRVILRRPRFRATLLPDGTWSVAKLLPPPKLNQRPP